MRAVTILVSWLLVSGIAAAEDEFGKEQIEKWGRYYRQRAAEYEIRSTGRERESLTFHPQPVLHWANPVIGNGSTHGECFLWTRDGRPEVFASVFSYHNAADTQRRVVAHVFNTLSTEDLAATHEGEVFWKPDRRSPEEFLPIANAPVPARSRPARLVQMRQLAREFSATSGGTGSTEELDLRLLPQPMYRNAEESANTLDGALFVFVTGTDPELLLLIEARRQEGQLGWSALATRHSHLTLRLEHDGVEVWQYVRGQSGRSSATQHSYFSEHGIDYQPRLLP